ncbi:response regulator [Desulfoscipio geothermicus]|uniref:Stage 0 sporulation protein A homolog n=1 Tax=Desulfoscipio geothermicus DSM 3669 TaxID=1121426 RepID=A0A1I6CYK9_9FIRM|nr:response regulator [Desulfoscipio geothermicus]SFQ98289.1 two-component system, response regulator, stage 0 sporulation protein F [Desulfoscipio geothermicus DSM 3669]
MPAKLYNLLVVDDQAGVRRLICEALLDEGYLVDQAASGKEALEKIKRKEFDLILLDIKMPNMNGLETLDEIKKIDKSATVVMMTAYGELEIMEAAGRKGAGGHICKPFDLDDLRRLVRDHLPQDDLDKALLK